MNVYSGKIVTASGSLCEVTVISAEPPREESALLAAVSVTGFAAGTLAGAR